MPTRRLNFFPKQLFFRFIVSQLLFTIPALLLTAIATRLYIVHSMRGVKTMSEVAPLFDGAVFFLAITATLIFTIISVWMGFRLILPLGNIIVKARAISRKDYSLLRESADAAENAVSASETGEWSDLESSLNRIERDMHRQDIRLSKEREEIEAIISAISEAVIAVDREGNLLFYNSQFAVLFGDKQLQKKQGRLSEFFRNPDVLDIFRDTLRDGEARGVSTQVQLKNEALPRFFSLSVAPLKLREKDTYGAVGVFHDVSELKRLDQIRIDFVANVSHELRTPLTSIKGYAQTMSADLKENRTELAVKYLDVISRNVDRLIALVHDLLNLSSLESGSELVKEDIPLADLTEKVLAQLERLRADKHQDIRVRVETPILHADPKRIEQVLFNLLENAFKYVPAEKSIEVQWLQDKNGDIYLHVLDDGPGIPAEHHARLFERFYRVDSSRNRDQGGTGLGLAIVKHIVQRHGGSVRVQGGLGRGTEFICSFPGAK